KPACCGEDRMNDRMYWLVAALLALTLAPPASAAETAKVGVIYPLSGNAASAGNSAKDAIELGAEIVNGTYPQLKGSALARAPGPRGVAPPGAGGPKTLGGARRGLPIPAPQGNPSAAQTQPRRLIPQERVAARLGASHSSVALTSTAVAERYGIPFLVADSVAL